MIPLTEEFIGGGTLQTTMEYLSATYGIISDQYLNDMCQTTINHMYVHTDLIVNVFNVIHKYAMMEESQGNPEIPQQLIRIGRIITTNIKIFSESL